MPKKEQEVNEPIIMNYDVPLHYCNHMKIDVGPDGPVIEFRSISPSIFTKDDSPSGSFNVDLEIHKIQPAFRMLITKENLFRFRDSLNKTLNSFR